MPFYCYWRDKVEFFNGSLKKQKKRESAIQLPDGLFTSDINPLVKMDVINDKFNMGKLLRAYGCEIDRSTMYCPFHDDEHTGKPSAKYHKETDSIYCFSENKVYTAYHALKILYGKNINKVFKLVWDELSDVDKRYYLDKHNEQKEVKIEESKWDIYNRKVLSKFKVGEVTYTQYKNALYKVLEILQKED
jgi:hypothetical protein